MNNYTVTTNLLLDPSGFMRGITRAQTAQESLAASIQTSMTAADAAYVRAGMSVENVAVAQARAAAQMLASTGVMTESQTVLAASLLAAGTAATVAGAEMVAADEKVIVANTATSGSFRGMGGTGLLALVGVSLALGKMAKGAMDADVQLASMKTALDNMGLPKANEQFVALSKNNTSFGFSVSQTAQSLQQFATITHSSSDAIRLNALAMDIARAKHLDIATATSMVTMEMRGASRGFAQFGVSLDSTLPRAKAIVKAMNDVQAKVKGQALDYMQTAAGKLDALKDSFSKVSDVIGKQVIPMITALLGFFQRFMPDIAILLAVATVIYTIVKATKLWAAANIFLETTNPFTLIAIAAALLIGGLIILWNHFKIVRDLIVDVANVGLHAFGDLIKFLGWVAEKLIQLFTAPLRAVLAIASHMPVVGKVAKATLKAIDTGIGDVGKAADAAGNKINSFQVSIDKLRNATIKNPFAAGTAIKPNDTSPINVKPIISKPKVKVDKTAEKIAKKYKADLKTLNADIDKALATLKTTRQKGSDAISAIISSSIGEPSELEKAFDSVKSTATSVLSEFDKLRKAIDDRMVGYAKADQARIINNLTLQSTLMVGLVAQRDVLTKELDDATKLQTGTIDAMAKSLLDYGIAAGILQKSTTDTVIRVVQTSAGVIVSQGNDTLNAVDSITKSLFAKLTTMQTFMANIKTLQSRGLSTDYLKQLISAGIDTSGDTVTALATASDAQISVINKTYGQITGLSNDFANTTGANLYDAGITNLTDYIAGLKTQETAVENQMNQITANITAQMAAIVPMTANVGKDTATALLDNLAKYINDPKNQKAVMANVQALADQIKSILAAAMTPYAPPPIIPKTPPPGGTTTGNSNTDQAKAGLNGLGGQKDLSNYGGTPVVTNSFAPGAFVLDKQGNVVTDPSKITTTINIGRVANARNIDL